MQTLYEKDVMWCIDKVAMRSLARYEREHPELFASLPFSELIEVRRKLIIRAFRPKISVKMCRRLFNRDYTIVPGEGPERATVNRTKNKFFDKLQATIIAAAERLESVT